MSEGTRARTAPGSGATTGEGALIGPVNYAWGRAHKQAMRELFGKVLSIGAIGESLPNAGSYIALDPGQRDHLGMPAARLHSRPDEMLQVCGAEDIFEDNGSYAVLSSTHVFGASRMGINPATSVVET